MAPAQVLMIDDNFEMDVRGAQVGPPGALVKTGKFHPAEKLDPGSALPEVILNSIADLPR